MKGRALILSYLDDLFGGHQSYVMAWTQFYIMLFVGSALGIIFHHEKIDVPC